MASLADHPDFPEMFRVSREQVWREFAPQFERFVAAGNVAAADRIQARVDERARQQAIVALRSMTDFEAGRGPLGRQRARPTGIDYSQTPGRASPLSVLTGMPREELTNPIMTPEEIGANSGIIQRLLGMFGATREAALAWERERAQPTAATTPASRDADVDAAVSEMIREMEGAWRNNTFSTALQRAGINPETPFDRADRVTTPDRGPPTLTGWEGQAGADLARRIMEGSPVDFGERMLTPTGTGRAQPPSLVPTRNPRPEGPSTVFSEEEMTPAVTNALLPTAGQREEMQAEFEGLPGVAMTVAPWARGAQLAGQGVRLAGQGAAWLAGTRAGQATARAVAHPATRVGAATTTVGVTTLAGTGETQTPGLTPSQILEGLRKDREDAVAARNRALAEREEEARGGRGRQAGRGPNWNRLTGEVERHGASIDRLDGEIRRTTYELSPQGQADATRVAEAERVLNRSLAAIRQPFHEAAPDWLQNVQPILPAILGFGTALAMRTPGGIGSRLSARRWGQATEAGLRPNATPAEIALNAALSRNYAGRYPAPRSYRDAYGMPMLIGGGEGFLSTNLPEGYNLFLPALNQARIAWQEYLDRLPAHEVYNAERERVRTLITRLPERNVWRDSALDYFGSSAFPIRTAGGIAEAAGGAGLGVTLGRLPAPSEARIGRLRAETATLDARLSGEGGGGRLPWAPPQTREMRLEQVPRGRGTGYRDATTGHWATREDLDLWFATRPRGRKNR